MMRLTRATRLLGCVLCCLCTVACTSAEKAQKPDSEEHRNAARKVAGLYKLYNDTFLSLEERVEGLMRNVNKAVDDSRKLEEILSADNGGDTAEIRKSIEAAQRDAKEAHQEAQLMASAASGVSAYIDKVLNFTSTFVVTTKKQHGTSKEVDEDTRIISWRSYVIKEGITPVDYEEKFARRDHILQGSRDLPMVNKEDVDKWTTNTQQLLERASKDVANVADAFVRPIVEKFAEELEKNHSNANSSTWNNDKDKRVKDHIATVKRLLGSGLLDIVEKEFKNVTTLMANTFRKLDTAQISERKVREEERERKGKKEERAEQERKRKEEEERAEQERKKKKEEEERAEQERKRKEEEERAEQERKRKEEEERAEQERKRKEEEERAEQERKKEEEEEERAEQERKRKKEEEERAEQERKRKEEEERAEQERKRKEEEERAEQERKKRKEEEERAEQERKRKEEEERAEQERKRKEEEERAEQERKKEEEEEERAEQERKRKKEEEERAEQERKRKEEEERAEQERKRKEEEERAEQERKKRKEEEERAEQERKKEEEERAEQERKRKEEEERAEQERKRKKEETVDAEAGLDNKSSLEDWVAVGDEELLRSIRMKSEQHARSDMAFSKYQNGIDYIVWVLTAAMTLLFVVLVIVLVLLLRNVEKRDGGRAQQGRTQSMTVNSEFLVIENASTVDDNFGENDAELQTVYSWYKQD